MLTWEQFLEKKESIEDKEERLGKDLDGDKEEGESKKHKDKVLGKKCKKCGYMKCCCK